MYHILIVDDDKTQAENVAATLHTFGYRTTSAHNHDEALLALDKHGPFALVLLDLVLGDPVLDGLAVCQKIRARPDPPPIIMLTVLSLETDMHKGLEIGASDYITRPFSNETLRVRIKTLLRTVAEAGKQPREESQQQQLLHIDEHLEIDPRKRKVFVYGREVDLTRREFDLLLYLVTYPGQVFSRKQLLEKVWGDPINFVPQTIDRHITSLREKIKDVARNPHYIFTERGDGYRFRDRKGRH
jgi:two-component system, OmpR family, alkaline phosphatase synthesis response regulator PhoP